MDEDSEWEQWFKRWGDYGVHATYYECNADFTVEDLYQMFKARIVSEIGEASGAVAVSADPKAMRSITEVPCHCRLCFWSGVTGDCEPDDDGTLCCPRCELAAEPVVIEYNEHEINPSGQTVRTDEP